MSQKTLRVGLLGFGTIGRAIAAAIRDGRAGQTSLIGALVRSPREADDLFTTVQLPELLAKHPDVVVEAAGQAALQTHAEAVLAGGADLMPLSVGAFADASFMERVHEAAESAGQRVLVPAGAIAGLDAIGAAALGEITEVTHIVRKPPSAFTPEQLGGPPGRELRLLYEGPARQGARLFPENVNVAAAVALAGIGLERTVLRVYVDPTVDRNTHEVRVCGYFGELNVTMRNLPTENPKTGRIVALSVARALRDRTASWVIGV